MDCRTVHDQLSTYLDHDLPPQTRVLLDRHFDACPPCRTALTQLRTITAWVGELPQITPSSAFLQQVRARVEHLPQPSRPGLFRRLAGSTPLQAAAALMVAVSAALVWQMTPYLWQESRQEMTDSHSDSDPWISHERSLTPVLDVPPFEPGLEESFPAPAPLVLMPPRQPWLTAREELVRVGHEPPFVPTRVDLPAGGRSAEMTVFPSLILRAEDPVQTAQQIWELVPGTGGALLQSQGMITPAGQAGHGPVRLTLAIAVNRYQSLIEAIRRLPGTTLAEERMAIIGRELWSGGTTSLRRVEHSQTATLPTMTLVITIAPR
jgi:hypothetical protein